jgi:hypothetical protein
MAYATGRPPKPASDRDAEVDYGPLLGFVSPAVRIDPHSHEVEATPQPDLRQIADIIRDRGSSNPPPGKPTE